MKFLINMFNHSEIGQRSLEDPIGIIARQLRALGHICEYTNNSFIEAYDGINIVIEGFTPWSCEHIARARKTRDARFIVIATEEPTDTGGFNHERVGAFHDRQQIFPAAMADIRPEAILALVPGAETWYSQFAPSRHIELGYAPSAVRHDRMEPDYVYGFYGSMTRRRRAVLRKVDRRVSQLSGKGLRVIHNFMSAKERDDEMRRTRILLQIRLNEKMGLVSSSRCATALHLGRAVIAEPHQLSKPWDEVIHFAKSADAFLDDVVNMRAFWQSLFQKQFERFKEIMSPERCIGQQIAELELTRPLGKYVPGVSAERVPILQGATI